MAKASNDNAKKIGEDCFKIAKALEEEAKELRELGRILLGKKTPGRKTK